MNTRSRINFSSLCVQAGARFGVRTFGVRHQKKSLKSYISQAIVDLVTIYNYTIDKLHITLTSHQCFYRACFHK